MPFYTPSGWSDNLFVTSGSFMVHMQSFGSRSLDLLINMPAVSVCIADGISMLNNTEVHWLASRNECMAPCSACPGATRDLTKHTVTMQVMRRQMMPPVLYSLGPITDWLSSKAIGGLSAKYDEVSQASSAAKVHCHFQNFSAFSCASPRQSNARCYTECQPCRRAQASRLQSQ